METTEGTHLQTNAYLYYVSRAPNLIPRDNVHSHTLAYTRIHAPTLLLDTGTVSAGQTKVQRAQDEPKNQAGVR
jgi:hypothetical protein